jgi:maltooligosyltrehalose synthase
MGKEKAAAPEGRRLQTAEAANHTIAMFRFSRRLCLLQTQPRLCVDIAYKDCSASASGSKWRRRTTLAKNGNFKPFPGFTRPWKLASLSLTF